MAGVASWLHEMRNHGQEHGSDAEGEKQTTIGQPRNQECKDRDDHAYQNQVSGVLGTRVRKAQPGGPPPAPRAGRQFVDAALAERVFQVPLQTVGESRWLGHD